MEDATAARAMFVPGYQPISRYRPLRMSCDLIWVEPNFVPIARERVRAYYLGCQPIEQSFAAHSMTATIRTRSPGRNSEDNSAIAQA